MEAQRIWIVGLIIAGLLSTLVFCTDHSHPNPVCEELLSERSNLTLNHSDDIAAIKDNSEMLEKCGCLH